MSWFINTYSSVDHSVDHPDATLVVSNKATNNNNHVTLYLSNGDDYSEITMDMRQIINLGEFLKTIVNRDESSKSTN